MHPQDLRGLTIAGLVLGDAVTAVAGLGKFLLGLLGLLAGGDHLFRPRPPHYDGSLSRLDAIASRTASR